MRAEFSEKFCWPGASSAFIISPCYLNTSFHHLNCCVELLWAVKTLSCYRGNYVREMMAPQKVLHAAEIGPPI